MSERPEGMNVIIELGIVDGEPVMGIKNRAISELDDRERQDFETIISAWAEELVQLRMLIGATNMLVHAGYEIEDLKKRMAASVDFGSILGTPDVTH